MMTNITVYTQSKKSLRHFLYAAAQNELSIMCNVLCKPSLHFHRAIMLDYRCIKQSTSQSMWTGKRGCIMSKMYKN